MPRVSVTIPVYNGATTVAQAIDSALRQDFRDLEVIVVNDGSTDSTDSILKQYGNRIAVVRHPTRRGFLPARNSSVAASSGEYIALLDADDFWLPNKLSKTVAAIEAQPGAVLAYSDCMMMREERLVLSPDLKPEVVRFFPPISLEKMLSTGPWRFIPSSVVMKRSAYDFGDDFAAETSDMTTVAGSDECVMLRARERGDFVYVQEPLVIFRDNPMAGWLDRWDGKAFIRVLRRRYRDRASGMITSVRNFYVDNLSEKALNEIKRGAPRDALKTLWRIMGYDRLYFFSPRTLARIFRRGAAGPLSNAIPTGRPPAEDR